MIKFVAFEIKTFRINRLNMQLIHESHYMVSSQVRKWSAINTSLVTYFTMQDANYNQNITYALGFIYD